MYADELARRKKSTQVLLRAVKLTVNIAVKEVSEKMGVDRLVLLCAGRQRAESDDYAGVAGRDGGGLIRGRRSNRLASPQVIEGAGEQGKRV